MITEEELTSEGVQDFMEHLTKNISHSQLAAMYFSMANTTAEILNEVTDGELDFEDVHNMHMHAIDTLIDDSEQGAVH